MGGHPAGVNHAFGNAFMIEMGDLFAEVKVFQQRWPAHAGLKRVLIVADLKPLISRQILARHGGIPLQVRLLGINDGGDGTAGAFFSLILVFLRK